MRIARFWIKSCLAVALASGCAVAVAHGATATVDGIKWTYTVFGGKATLDSVPDSTSGAIVIPSSLGGYPVTDIGEKAFENCSNLTSVTIPACVTSIGILSSLSDAVDAFDPDVSIDPTLSFAFAGCSGLTDIHVEGNNLVYASEGGVLFTKDRKTLLFCPNGKTGAYSVPDGVLQIGDGEAYYGHFRYVWGWPAFAGCSKLTQVSIPNGVGVIDDRSFEDCRGLTSVVIPNSVTNIGCGAFAGCSGLTTLSIGSGVENIGECAFCACTGLTMLTIPDSLTGYGSSVVSGCNSLETLYVPARFEETDMLSLLWGVPKGCRVVYYEYGVTLAANAWSFTAAGANSQELGVIADVPWTAESSVSWLTVRTGSGSGDGAIVYDVAANTGTGARTGAITVTGAGITRTFTVTQDGWVATLELGAVSRTFAPDAAGGMMLSVAANVSWTAESAVAWLTLKAAAGDGNGTITYDVAANPGTEERAGAITVTGGGLTRIFLATQSGQAARLELGTNTRTFTADAASGNELAVSANVPWTAVSSASWLAVLSPNGTGNGVVAYDVAANPGTGERMGAITVSGGGLTRIFLVTQSGKTETQRTPVGVPCQWLEENAAGILAAAGGDYEAAAMAFAANGLPVWKCYVAGLSTTDAEADFKVKSISLADEELKVEWTPDLNDNGTKTNRIYVIQGKQSMGDEWGEKTPGSRFFRVWVGVPEP